jgi:hypothetical protein
MCATLQQSQLGKGRPQAKSENGQIRPFSASQAESSRVMNVSASSVKDAISMQASVQ